MDKIQPDILNSESQRSLGTVAMEVTQAKRRLQRAAWSAKAEAQDRGEASHGRITNPVITELEYLEKLIQNFQFSFGLKDEESEK